jgi:parallel beta-helix repeat protein
MSLQRRATRNRPARRLHLAIEAVEGRSLLSTLLVSPTGSLHGQPAFTTIQRAVIAARPGDTINVGPGTYHENVVINESLALLGAEAGVNPITGLRTNPAKESTIDGSIQINSATNVAVDGFSLNDPGSVPLADNQDVANLLTNNIILPGANNGIVVTQGQLVTVSDNEVKDPVLDGIFVNRFPATPTFDSILGNEVFGAGLDGIDVNFAAGLAVRNNNVFGSGVFGVDIEQSTGVQASNNLLTGNAAGALFFESTGSIEQNTVEFNRTDGLDIEGDKGDFIGTNTTSNNGTSGRGDGILLLNVSNEALETNKVTHNHTDGIAVFGTSTGLKVGGNDAEDNGGNGISLNGTTSSFVTANTANGNSTGILLAGSSFNQIIGNVADNNTVDGIHLDTTSVFNVVKDNQALGNGNLDVEDDSSGFLTAGTHNTWTGNVEKKDNRHGGLGH